MPGEFVPVPQLPEKTEAERRQGNEGRKKSKTCRADSRTAAVWTLKLQSPGLHAERAAGADPVADEKTENNNGQRYLKCQVLACLDGLTAIEGDKDQNRQYEQRQAEQAVI